MAFKIKYAGTEVVCETVQDVAALKAYMDSAERSTPRLQPKATARPFISAAVPPHAPMGLRRAGGFDVWSATGKLLSTIQQGDGGAKGEALVSALEVQHPKGLGGRLALINRKIAEDGFEPEQVFTSVKDSSTGNERVWKPGPQLEEYMRKLVREVAE